MSPRLWLGSRNAQYVARKYLLIHMKIIRFIVCRFSVIPNIYNISSVATVVKVLFNKADAIFAKVWKFIEVNADNITGIRLCQIK